MIDRARQSANDTVRLRLRSTGKIDVRTYGGDDIMHITPPQGTNNLQVRELKIDKGDGNHALRLEGGVINQADVKIGAGVDSIGIDSLNNVTIHQGNIDGGSGGGSEDHLLFNRNRLRGRVTLANIERVR